MICKQCSSAIVDTADFCPVCGMKQHPNAHTAPQAAPQPAFDPYEEATVGPASYSRPAAQQPQAAPQENDYDEATVGPTFQRRFTPEKPVTPAQPVAPQPVAEPVSDGKVTFGQAIKLFFQNFFNFKGRATKSEYWWTFLFICLVNLGLLILAEVIPALPSIASLLLEVGSIAIAVRRLHDTGKSGGWWFMVLIPLAGPIILLVLLLKASSDDNKWGPRR